jgi:adenylate cyclase
MERTLVALWFADIAGYSEHAAKDESGALRLVEILQDLASETVPQFRGRVVKFLGDAVLAQFPSAELAVRAAIDLSNGYVQRSDAIGRIEHLRIGVHLADVAVAADGDLYGDGVNTAARIQEDAEPGQVVISQDVWRQLRGRREFRFEHLGDRPLKGIGPIGLYVGTMESGATSVSKPSATDNLRSQTQMPAIRSLAVLPFADLSAERDQGHFGDGVAEEILNALTKIGDLRVPARSSCFAFRGLNLDARDIGRRLGVEALLEGSVRKAGQRLRISVQLIDAHNGYHLWSERFDREVADASLFRTRSRVVSLWPWVFHWVKAKSVTWSKHPLRMLRHTSFIYVAGNFFKSGPGKTSILLERCSSVRLELIRISLRHGQDWRPRMCTFMAAIASHICKKLTKPAPTL